MKTKTVGYPLDNLPKPTPERLAELERLEALPGEQIDTSDIPELTEAQLAEMRRGGGALSPNQETDYDAGRR